MTFIRYAKDGGCCNVENAEAPEAAACCEGEEACCPPGCC
jgi:hypothetical protein